MTCMIMYALMLVYARHDFTILYMFFRSTVSAFAFKGPRKKTEFAVSYDTNKCRKITPLMMWYKATARQRSAAEFIRRRADGLHGVSYHWRRFPWTYQEAPSKFHKPFRTWIPVLISNITFDSVFSHWNDLGVKGVKRIEGEAIPDRL